MYMHQPFETRSLAGQQDILNAVQDLGARDFVAKPLRYSKKVRSSAAEIRPG